MACPAERDGRRNAVPGSREVTVSLSRQAEKDCVPEQAGSSLVPRQRGLLSPSR